MKFNSGGHVEWIEGNKKTYEVAKMGKFDYEMRSPIEAPHGIPVDPNPLYGGGGE